MKFDLIFGDLSYEKQEEIQEAIKDRKSQELKQEAEEYKQAHPEEKRDWQKVIEEMYSDDLEDLLDTLVTSEINDHFEGYAIINY